MSEIKLTVAQVAEQVGETDHVVRNWLKQFRDFIPTEKSSGGYNLFTQDSIDVISRIRKMHREQNLTIRQIEAILMGAERPIVKQEESAAAVETMDAVRDLLEEQRQFNAALIGKLDEQRQQFEKFVQRRDEQIMFVLREIKESRDQKRLGSGRRKGWLKRWLKGSIGYDE